MQIISSAALSTKYQILSGFGFCNLEDKCSQNTGCMPHAFGSSGTLITLNCNVCIWSSVQQLHLNIAAKKEIMDFFFILQIKYIQELDTAQR